MTETAEHTIELAGEPVFYRTAGDGGCPAVLLHSLPTSSDDWQPFLDVGGRLIAPDLPGFGRSTKGGHLGYALDDHVRFLGDFLDAIAPDGAIALGGHGWGAAVALAYAQARPARVSGLVLIDSLPLLDGFTWPRAVRHGLRPGIGELVMGSLTRRRLARLLRAGAADPDAWTEDRIDAVWAQFDQGTQRAILRVARSITPAGLVAAGAGLAALDVPALVVWGERDPWLDARFGRAYAERLPDARLELVPGAGHWPWLEDPRVVQLVTSFLGDLA